MIEKITGKIMQWRWMVTAATYASRCGVPIEIVSKIILRHSNLSTIRCIWVK
jgi:hypothetical protein